MRELVVVTMGINTAGAFKNQLQRLLGNGVNIKYYCLKGKMPEKISDVIVLFSSNEVWMESEKYLGNGCTVIVARRSINYNAVGKLLEIPSGTDVLLVNDLISSTNQTIALLQTSGIDHINYYPYSPQITQYPSLKIAVTPGESELVPDSIEYVIDIENRLIDITTLTEILLQLDLLDVYADFLSANYVRDIIRLTKNIREGILEREHLKELVRRRFIKEQKLARYTFSKIVGESPAIQYTLNLAKKMAISSSTILIQGESGTGKEIIAQGIHNLSSRAGGPFIAVNFAALTENLLESELFGYIEGAFTGANRGGSPGLFEEAHHGTIFLDEIGDAPLPFQVKLLRVLQEQQIRRVGSAKVIPIDVRVIAATNQDLKLLIAEGKFRQDLYYRLNVLPIKVPPLRDRQEDILLLARNFYEDTKTVKTLPAEEYFKLLAPYFLQYSWPGNIRELQNVVEYLTNICPDEAPAPELLPIDLQEIACKEVADVVTNATWEQAVLAAIATANRSNLSIGRRSLAKQLCLPENQVREIIQALVSKGLIVQHKGRSGLKITAGLSQKQEIGDAVKN